MLYCTDCQEPVCITCNNKEKQCCKGTDLKPLKLSDLPKRVQEMLKNLNVEVECPCGKEAENSGETPTPGADADESFCIAQTRNLFEI